MESAKNECSSLKRGAHFRLAFLCLFAVVASSLFVFAPVARADVLDTSLFDKKIHFTVSGYAGMSALANFPVLVRLSDVPGFDFSDFSTPAAELRFTDAAGNNLNYEIDTWDSVASNALVWVSVPSLSGKTTEIRAYYGPSSTSGLPSVSSDAVWSSAGYVGVWHFNEQNADGSYPDATGRGATASRIAGDATPNAPTSATPSPNGTTYHVANSVLAVASANTASWTFSSTGYSVEAWLIPTGNYNRMFVQTTGMNTGNAFAFGPTEVYQMSDEFGGYAGGWTSAVASQSDWRFVTGVWANSGKSFATRTCVNGSNQAGTKDKVAVDFDSTGMALTGRNGTDQGSTVMNFSVDEIRVRTGETSSDWMDANYATQNNPGFLTASSVMDCRSVGLSLSVNGGTCVVFSSLVDGINLSGGQSATLKVLYGTDENALTDELVVSDSVTASGTFPAQVKGLTRGTTYYFKSVLVLPGDQLVESEVLPVTMITDYTTGMRRIEYIEGTGTQYIDSGYYPGPNTHVKADYQFTTKVPQHRVFGIKTGTYFGAYINGLGNFGYVLSDSADWSAVGGNSPTPYDTNRCLHDFNYINENDQHAYTIYGPDGSVKATQSPLAGSATKTATVTLTIAADRKSATEVDANETAQHHRIYSVLFDEGAALTAALAPAVRTSDGAVGLYDSVRNGVFLQSASVDSYVVGPSVTTVERFTDTTLTAVDLTFLGAPYARTLKVAYGSGFGGDNPADWDVTETVGTVAAGATSFSVTAIPDNWGSDDACVLRCYFDDGTSFPLWSDTIVYKATLEPSVTITDVNGTGGDKLVVRGTLGYFPGDDCTLSVRVTKSGGSPVVWSNLTNVTETGNFELTLCESDTAAERYIEPGATYSVVVEAEAGETSGSSFPAIAVTKGAPAFASSSSSVNQRTVTFTGNLSDLGANTNATVTLYVGETADSLVPVEDPVTRKETGSFNIAHTFDTFDKTYYWQLCAVATTAGGNAITTRTAVASCKTLDKTIYTWQAVEGDWNGDWEDPAHWSPSNADCFGYPQSSAATVDFTDCTTDHPVVVNVHGKYTVGTFKCYGRAASDIAFVGTGVATSGLTGGGYGQTKIASDSTLEFRDMSLTLNGDWELLRDTDRTNVTFRLSGVTGSTTGYFALAAGYCRAEFLNGTDFTGGMKFNIGGTNTVVVIDDSTIQANGSPYGFIFNADSHNWGGMEFHFRGKAPQMLSSKSFFPFSHHPDINHHFIFEVPVGGYAEAPIQFTHDSTKMFQGGHATADYHVIISPDSPALKRSGEKLENVPLIYAEAGFALTDTRTMTFEPVEYKGEPSGKLSWGVDDVPLADGEQLSKARQVLLDLRGKKPPTVIRLR